MSTKVADHHTAIHEAGHTVAHIRLGLEHDGANIIRVDGRLGAAKGEGKGHVWDKGGAESVVLAFCSGYAAMVAVGCTEFEALAGTEDDFEQAGELIAEWVLPGDIEAWQARAVDLMCRHENMAAVALIAEHLLQRKRLDGDYCDVLVEVSDGAATKADLARYLALREHIEQDLESKRA